MFTDLIEKLDAAERVLLTTHARPDGDALGTTAAMTLALREKGKHAELLILSPMPARYRFVYENAGLDWHEAPPAMDPFDTLLVCDTGTWSQLPGMQDTLADWGGVKLVLDHHQTQQDWPDLHCVSVEAAAAAELAAGVLEQWGVALSPRLAEPLYVGMATDTGWFAYSSTTANTMRRAADCLEAGVDLDALFQRLRQSDSASRLKLWQTGLASMQLHADDRVATISLRRSDYDAANATPDDGEDLVNEPMRIGSVQVSAIFGESLDEHGPLPTKVSLRSKGQVNVAEVCQQFGGGGHARAAGCRVDLPLETAREQVVERLRTRFTGGR